MAIPREVAFKLLDGTAQHELFEKTLWEDDDLCKHFENSNFVAPKVEEVAETKV